MRSGVIHPSVTLHGQATPLSAVLRGPGSWPTGTDAAAQKCEVLADVP
jgi:hypothetical protein